MAKSQGVRQSPEKKSCGLEWNSLYSVKKECALEIVEIQQCLLKKVRSAASLEDSETQNEVGSSPVEQQSPMEQAITKLATALISQGYVHDLRPFSKSKPKN